MPEGVIYMIEVIYKDEKQTAKGNEESFNLPKNIRQIGIPNEKYRIYIEDYVYTFLKKIAEKAEEEEKGAAAVFTGEIKWNSGTDYLFIRGALTAEAGEISAEHVEFSDLTWQKLHEEIEHYFAGQEIIGWFLTQKSLQMEVTEGVQRIHMKLFGGEKALMLMDPVEKEEAFFCYDNGRLLRQSGYYIYYEKNPQMQAYMLEKNPELNQPDNVFLLDIVLLHCNSSDHIKICQAHVLHVCRGQPLETLFHAVGEDAHHTEHLRACRAQNLHHVQNASAGGNEVLHHYDLLTLFKSSFDLVLPAMVLARAADIAHWKLHHVSDNGRVRDTCRARAHKHLRLRIFALNGLHDRRLHLRAHIGCSENQAIVAVDGAFDAAGPGEGLVRTEEYRTDGEQSLRNAAFQMLHFYLFSFQNVSLLTE